YFLRPIGRLRAGITLTRAQQEVESAAAQVRKNFSLYATARFYERVEPMQKALVQDVRPAILALMGAVIFLLLIACANVAYLLLVRASLRRPELAVRSALGAGRRRIMQQMLAEAVLLTAIGAAIGVALAWAGVRELLGVHVPQCARAATHECRGRSGSCAHHAHGRRPGGCGGAGRGGLLRDSRAIACDTRFAACARVVSVPAGRGLKVDAVGYRRR